MINITKYQVMISKDINQKIFLNLYDFITFDKKENKKQLSIEIICLSSVNFLY